MARTMLQTILQKIFPKYMPAKNNKEWFEEWVSPVSKECLELFDKHGCPDCLPVDRNRIKFSRVKRSLLNKPVNDKNRTFEQFYGAQVGMRCPLDCARICDREGKPRYKKIKEQTKHIKLKRVFRKHDKGMA